MGGECGAEIWKYDEHAQMGCKWAVVGGVEGGVAGRSACCA